jgi:hypothetical protein
MTTKPGLKFSVAAIDNVKEILKALPPAPRETKEVSLREAIEELAPAIRGLLAKGYSRQQVVDLIQEQGVGCSLTSLKAYFRTPAKTKTKPSAASTAGPTAGSQATGPAPARLVVSGGSGGTEVGAAAASRDAAPTHAQSPTGRAAGGEGGAGIAATGGAGRAASKAS